MNENVEVIYCPECDSENVVVRELETSPAKIIRKSMDDLGSRRIRRVNRGKAHKYKNFKAVCFNCGYTKEWKI